MTKRLLLLAPIVVITLLFVGQGLWTALSQSLVTDGSAPVLSNYEALLSRNEFWSSFRVSVYVAFTSTAISLVLGTLLTRAMFRLFKGSDQQWRLLAWFPMLIPHFVAAYIIVLFFAPSGYLSSVTASIGWIDSIASFPVIVNDPLYIGVILTYVWKEIPFVVLMLLPVYQEIDWRMEEANATLGGGAWQTFRHVELPYVGPVSAEVFLILFVFILGAFEVPALLGVTFPSMLPILAYEWFYQAAWTNRPLAQAMLILLSVMSLLAAWLLFSLSRRKWMKGGQAYE
ncbi:sugar ABC transporter permease [Paenalkalicoccus suaedae]|uniref:Sugar ABC transporter permease n=1 Tax=Paenalkalicoccus suaedae TaxID=2592382 RepID=A0A859FHT9_9BACI|nr:sugar ABC transporter permease [Paenalkalicoccus suaedae]QKS72923.1 sugar ABC transporter permease [Paenalkalicoccus suaedae]